MLIETRQLSYAYPDRQVMLFPDVICRQGESILIKGPSGSGKTTFLHLLAGIIRPKAGAVCIQNQDISKFSHGVMDVFRGRHIGMVFQQHFFLQGLDVLENLLAVQKLSGLPADRVYLEQLMVSLDIHHLKKEKPDRISQGEQQRFSIARALANKPWIVLADEPTSSLDDANCTRFLDLVQTVQQTTNTTWVIATHDQRMKRIFQHIYTL